MSKTEDMRALRQALREEASRAGKRASTPARGERRGSRSGLEPAPCGHRSIGNKSCTRPLGHPEKNHRYS